MNNTKVVTQKVRANYVNVFRPKINDLNGQEEYSITLIIPKTDKKTIEAINYATSAAIEKKWPTRAPDGLRYPLRDGDIEKKDDENYENSFFIKTKSYEKPGIVDNKLNPIINPQDFISGDFCRVSMNAYAYDQKGNKGVTFYLNNIQVLERGETIEGKSRPENDFDVIEESAW